MPGKHLTGGFLTGLIVLTSGCDDSIRFHSDIAPVLEQKCLSCHNPSLPEGDLDLMTDPYDALIEVASTQSTYSLVTPGNHQDSYLWHKLNGSQSLAGGAGTRMPLDDGFNETLVDDVADWIDAGAKP